MSQIKAISVVGLGKLGLCLAACFADRGFKVTGVDIDIEKLDKINKGLAPIEETGLPSLIKKVKGNLWVTQDYKQAILNSSITFIVVATPSLADGSFSNEYLEKALHNLGTALKNKKGYHLVVVTSTVMPQTTDKVAKFVLEKTSGKKCGKDFGLVYNPEFIALGSVIHDFLNPDFILIGEMDKRDGDTLEEIYKITCQNNPRFARMSTLNAEIAKISLNCYITTKITFANSLATICERIKGADAHIITDAIGLDSRIGSKYIKPGLGYGGPCFPRDNIAFSSFARLLETKAKLVEMVDEVNRDQAIRAVGRINEILAASGRKKKSICVGILGLSYKPNTPVTEDSQALNIAQLLINEGYRVNVYDPQAMGNAKSVLGNSVKYANNIEECLTCVDLGVIAVPWDEFKKINFKRLNKNIVLLDCWSMLRGLKKVNVKYLGVGL